MSWRDRLNRSLYGLGWRAGPLLRGRLAWALVALGSRAAAAGLAPTEVLQRNQSLVRGRQATPAEVREALASYLRMWTEVLSLPAWSTAEVVGSVVTDPVGEALLRAEFPRRGAVIALPHQGNWDLVGAWACRTGLPVTTVAEELGGAEFAAFTRFRTDLGMEVLSHRDPRALQRLTAAVGEGRVVCLMSDRLLAGSGLQVEWQLPGGSRPVSLPVGPALVARRTGALLLGLGTHYQGDRLALTFSAPIEHRSGRAGLTAMTQDLADFFSARVSAHPADWHLMQPFFDLEPEVGR